MSDNNYQEVIKNNKLFDGIPPQNLKFGFQSEQIIRKKEGEIIFQKGDESKNTFLIIAGKVKIKVYIENKSVKLNKSINDFFGEIEVLEETYRRSAAVANTDCILYALTRGDLRTFLADNPEINDNIIAYNKVEIPELQITIRPGLLTKDTDKLYITSPEDREKIESFEEKEGTDDANRDERKKEIDESAKKISDIEEDTEEEEADREAGEDIVLIEERKSEAIRNQVATSGNDSAGKIMPADVKTEADQTIQEEILIREDFNDSNDISGPGENSQSEEKIPSEEIANIPEENFGIQNEKDAVEDFEEEIDDISLEEDNVTESVPDIKSSESEIQEEDNTRLIRQDSAEKAEEIPDEISEEEKLRYEAEEEKLKYDDTEIGTDRILGAIKKINASFDKQTVYSNVVHEAVKLTEAQAGILYRADSSKNLLTTEIESETGLTEVSYSFSNGLTGLAAESGEIINVREPVKDFRFSEDIDSIRGLVSSSLLCVPVKDDNYDTIAVISLANSSSGKFTVSDEEKISQLVPHISQTLQCLNGIDKLLDENKNIYLSTLTSFITDNIQTPVLTMKYYAGQIKKKNVSQDIKTVLSVLMDEADSVVDFLHSTLAFTENINPVRIEKCSLKDVMDNTLGLLAEYVESRNMGLYKKVESTINVKLDKKAFYQACHQIAKNACDAMGESGNIYITAKQSGDLVNIEFRDTGPGIPDEIKSEIFKPFKSFKKENGTGLGLAIAQKIIRDHGGELTVESNPGQGATFIISLPVFDEI